MTSEGIPKKAALAQYLRAAILTQELPPGDDLDETVLAAQFALSRTPLRDVLRDLAGAGYVDLRSGRGARVAELSHRTLRGFFQAAPMIYGAILQLAAEHATQDQIAALKEAQRGFTAALRAQDVAARSLANNRFHEITGAMANNPYLLPSFQRLLIDHARIGMTFFRSHSPDQRSRLALASQQHDEIIAAIEAADATRAAALAQDHWALSRDQILEFVMPRGLDAQLETLTTRGADDATLSI